MYSVSKSGSCTPHIPTNGSTFVACPRPQNRSRDQVRVLRSLGFFCFAIENESICFGHFPFSNDHTDCRWAKPEFLCDVDSLSFRISVHCSQNLKVLLYQQWLVPPGHNPERSKIASPTEHPQKSNSMQMVPPQGGAQGWSDKTLLICHVWQQWLQAPFATLTIFRVMSCGRTAHYFR